MPIEDLIQSFQQQQEAARQANIQRYEEALQIYDEIIKQYRPEGGFLKGAYAELGREKERTLAGQQQQLVSSGLFGTSITAGLGQKWEAEVGQPARLKLEDVRMGRLSEALQAKAGAVERREDVGPDYSLIAQLAAQAGGRPVSAAGLPTARPSISELYGEQIGGEAFLRGTSTASTAPRPVSQPYVPRAERPGYVSPYTQAVSAGGAVKGKVPFDPTMGMLDYATATKLDAFQPGQAQQLDYSLGPVPEAAKAGLRKIAPKASERGLYELYHGLAR